MLKFRIKILKNILDAPNPEQVKFSMNEILHEIEESDVSNKRFSQYMKSVKSDIFFQMRLKHSRREFNNLAEALKMLNEGISINNTLY
jgi:hypothetical protein